MMESELKEIIENADLIIPDFSFTIISEDEVRIVSLNNIKDFCILNRKDGKVIVASMDDNLQLIAQRAFFKNRAFLDL